ncbi:MAG TPA: hypothetical protein PKH97_05055 [Tetrasphaera sp.]|nr:hypothetical protein [Tetrasphaera sp.]HNQ06538.1 hypothetical protein [Tetrasphaera sp.]
MDQPSLNVSIAAAAPWLPADAANGAPAPHTVTEITTGPSNSRKPAAC